MGHGSSGSRRLRGIGLPKSVRQRQRSCLFGRDLRSLWQTDFATPMDHGSSGSRRLRGIGLPKSVRQRQRSCLFGRDLRSLWQTEFATPMDHGASHPTKPLRALARTPTARDDTVYSLGCFVLGSDGHTIRRYGKRRYTTTASFPPFHLSTFPPHLPIGIRNQSSRSPRLARMTNLDEIVYPCSEIARTPANAFS